MKKTHFFILFVSGLLFVNGLISQPVDIYVAQKVAESKIRTLGYSDNFQLKTNHEVFFDHSGNSLFFAFQLDPVGYIMVSGYQSLPPVIAYSFTNDYKTKDQEKNILVDIISRDLNNRLINIEWGDGKRKESRKLEWEQLISGNQNSYGNKPFEQWPPAGTTSTGGWLETNWSQGAPYNNFCPMDPVTGQRSVAGCPSIALAMIINYYKSLNETEFTDLEDDYYHSYAGRNYWIDDDFEEIDFLPFPVVNSYFDTISNSFLNHT
ncbi:MAG: C10 family peptidase, partial [Bacteroidales bacterium]|nr:C10 family peptidase [Bacteroidales bacterium]